jgi:hypothetical protein
MAARLEHERLADPVVVPQEDLALLSHRDIRQDRTATGDDANRIAAGMGIDAEEGMAGHRILRECQRKRVME